MDQSSGNKLETFAVSPRNSGVDPMREKSERNAKLAKREAIARQMTDGLSSMEIKKLLEEIERHIRERSRSPGQRTSK